MAVQYGNAGALQVQLKGPYGSVAIRVVTISLPAHGWKGAVSPYAQVAAVDGMTLTGKVDLQPDEEQLEAMRRQGRAFAAENEEGQVTVYAFGEKPGEDLTFQATITEVQR